MLTAKVMEEDKIRGLQLGVDDYITKPYNIRELQARIKNLIVNKYSRDKWRLENKVGNESEELLTAEEKLLAKAEKYIRKYLDKTELSVSKLAGSLGYSQRHLERLLKKYSGLTPAAYIKEIRLQMAHQILEKKQLSSIKEVCYHVGFESPASFSTNFKKRFGKSPGEIHHKKHKT